jgi:hypothetical protein
MSRVRLIAGLFLLLLATTWVVLLMLLQHPSRGPASGISHRPAANLDIYLALAPSYAAAAIVTVIMFAGLILSQLRNSKKATAPARWAIMFGVVMIAWILIVFAMDDAHRGPQVFTQRDSCSWSSPYFHGSPCWPSSSSSQKDESRGNGKPPRPCAANGR